MNVSEKTPTERRSVCKCDKTSVRNIGNSDSQR